MTRPEDEATRTSTAASGEAASDPALDATVPSPGNTPLTRPGAAGELLAPGERIGRYEIREVLGSGGMGVVYRAHDPDLSRDLAIKVVQPFASGARAQQRLLEEARAMAKLRHPNIVPVFDVGTTDRGVFIVMPLFGGGTLHDWLRTEKRSWRAVFDTFVAAGRGLAAAHAAGLIHRDFKPRNVFLGDAGEVLVGDFGIAAETMASIDPDAPPTASTEVSTIAGTPAYMAPEQATGGQIDARADQYSFCISFWEGLHGERPGEAETRSHGALAPRGLPTVPAQRRDAPTWLGAAIARGFSPSRDRRWPTMAALLAHLERRSRRPRLMAATAGVTALAAVAVVVTASQLHPDRGATPAPCPDPVARLDDLWDAAIRSKVETVFLATGASYARETLDLIVPALDDYARRWRTMHVEACKAGQIDRSQSADLLDRRMVCLDRRLGLFGALTSSLAATTEVRSVERATVLVSNLPELAECSNASRLLALTPMPSEPRIRAEIEALQRELDAITALKWKGDHREQLRRANDAVTHARAIAYAPLLARALETLRKANSDNGQPDEAVARELALVAARGGDDTMAAAAWLGLLLDITNHDDRQDDARMVETVALAAIERAGSPPWLVYRQQIASAVRAYNAGEYAVAKQHLATAIATATTAPLLAEAKGMLAKVTMVSDGPSTALPLAEENVRTYETLFGPNHPFIPDELIFLAQVLTHVGDLERARTLTQRAFEIQRKTLSPDSVDLAYTAQTLASIAADTGDLAAARTEYQRAVRIFAEHGDTRRQAYALVGLGDVTSELDGPAAARPLREQALALLGDGTDQSPGNYGQVMVGVATSHIDLGDCASARPLLERATKLLTSTRPELVAVPLRQRARCQLAARRLDAAIADLERADTLCRAGDCEVTAEVRWDLGRLLVEQRRAPARGLELVREARTIWATRGVAPRLKEVDRWLAEHAPDVTPKAPADPDRKRP